MIKEILYEYGCEPLAFIYELYDLTYYCHAMCDNEYMMVLARPSMIDDIKANRITLREVLTRAQLKYLFNIADNTITSVEDFEEKYLPYEGAYLSPKEKT